MGIQGSVNRMTQGHHRQILFPSPCQTNCAWANRRLRFTRESLNGHAMFTAPHYTTLGILPDAPQAAVKSAYLKLAKKWHPDLNAGSKIAEERFKAIGAAYEVLGIPGKRDAYDKSHGNGGHGPAEPDFGPTAGASGQTRPKKKDRDASSAILKGPVVQLTLAEAFAGGFAPADLPAGGPCFTCSGIGEIPHIAGLCFNCLGIGYVATRYSLHGFSLCLKCGGAGRTVVSHTCPECHGSGYCGIEGVVMKGTVSYPAGVRDGSIIRISSGDQRIFEVMIKVKPTRAFIRNGDDLVTKRQISAKRAAAGSAIVISGVDGRKVRLKIPKGAVDRTRFRLVGYGMPRIGGGRGDWYVELAVSAN
jgi:molecular chaperone DnaJ